MEYTEFHQNICDIKMNHQKRHTTECIGTDIEMDSESE